MNKYRLKVLYPSTNQGYPQYYNTMVIAENIGVGETGYRFYIGSKLVSAYPTQYTIIELIEEVKKDGE